jgi:hypothetical protein
MNDVELKGYGVEVVLAIHARAAEIAHEFGERWLQRDGTQQDRQLALGLLCPICLAEIVVVLPADFNSTDAVQVLGTASVCLHDAPTTNGPSEVVAETLALAN